VNYLLSKKFDGTYTMNFIGTETLTPTNKTLYLRPTSPIRGIKNIKSYEQVVRGDIDSSQYLSVYFKYQSKYDNKEAECQDCWSEMKPISELTGITILPNVPFDIELFYYRVDDRVDNLAPTNIYLGDDAASPAVVISGEYEFNYTDGPFTLTDTIDEVVLMPKDIYKVFSISDFQVIADDLGNLDLMYRVTQDNCRTYSKWEPLTKANISTFRFNNLRFARIEYKIKTIYPLSQPINVYDVILIGDFQNVSANYLKTNRYGIRQDCLIPYFNRLTGNTDTCGWNISTTSGKTYSDAPGNGQPTNTMSAYDLNMNFYTQGLSCYSANPTTTVPSGGIMTNIDVQNQANSDTMWQPYDITQIMTLANTMANQLNSIFAWDIDYMLTDTDANGTDFILHEYQLYNVVDMKKVKVLVPDNKFPDNMVKFNQFNLDLFDTFEIHILKDEFKRKFGIDKRPSENDIIFFCPINRLFYIKHAQIFRDVMNAGYYYKVILEKYEQKTNIRNLHEESKALLDTLTKNTTLDEIMGVEREQDEIKIANIEQLKPFTFDPMRYIVNNKTIRVQETLTNGTFEFSKSHYDFKDVIGKQAIIYKKTDNVLTESNNRSFICWFNFNNGWSEDKPNKNAWKTYDISTTANFWLLNNLDSDNKGYRIWYHKKDINFQVNDQYYKLQNLDLLTNIWYGLVINMDQRQQVIEIKLYQRDNDYNIKFFNSDTYQMATIGWLDTTGYTALISAGYKPVNNMELHTVSTTFKIIKETFYDSVNVQSFENEADLTIEGSNIKYTNLRVLNDIIPDDQEIVNTLNQHMIYNGEKIIFIDNADRNVYTDNYINKNWI
jgi:hypothetical protein